MLCSRCSEVVKPIVAVDIDGVLGDYHSHFLRFAARYLDTMPSLPLYDGTDPFSEWCAMSFDITVEEYRRIKLAYRQGAQKRSMPIFDGARALCWAVRDQAAELWLTTTRPYLSLDNVITDTVFWLERYEIKYDGLLFDDDKYAVLAERVDPNRVVAIFDDQFDMVIAAHDVWKRDLAWLVRGRYNFGVRWRQMCELDSAVDIALQSISKWWERDASAV